MDNKYFTAKLEPSDRPDIKLFDRGPYLVSLLKDSFKLHTLLSIGATLQVMLCLLLPLRWAIVPACALLINSLITTTIQVRDPSHNYAKHVIPGRVSALPPSPSTGLHGPKPSNEPLVVFQLGAQPNHPLGILGPGWKQMGQYFNDMIGELHQNRDDYGFMGSSGWKGGDRQTHNTMLLTFYFRDVEGLHKFAHGPLHRRGWDGYQKGKEWNKNIGIFHETFLVQPGGHENVYVNAYPVLLGRAAVKASTKDGEKYVNTLVSADVPALKTQWARLGRDASGKVKTERE